MSPMPWQREKTLDELHEENERLDIELSAAQRRAALIKLKEAGLTKKSFGSWREIWHWFKTH